MHTSCLQIFQGAVSDKIYLHDDDDGHGKYKDNDKDNDKDNNKYI